MKPVEDPRGMGLKARYVATNLMHVFVLFLIEENQTPVAVVHGLYMVPSDGERVRGGGRLHIIRANPHGGILMLVLCLDSLLVFLGSGSDVTLGTNTNLWVSDQRPRALTY